MVLGGGGGQWFHDNSTKALVIKRVTMGGGWFINSPKLRDVIYGRPLNRNKIIHYRSSWSVTFFLFSRLLGFFPIRVPRLNRGSAEDIKNETSRDLNPCRCQKYDFPGIQSLLKKRNTIKISRLFAITVFFLF